MTQDTVPRAPTAEYFQFNTWWTPNQIRDSFIDADYTLTSAKLDLLKGLALAEQAWRKSFAADGKRDVFVECPLCKGYHGQVNNIDGLCELHEQQTAPMRYDNKT